MKYAILISAVIIIILNSFSCSSPSGPNDSLALKLSDVSCTEAWLNVNGQTGSDVILNRNGKEVRKTTLASSSQTIYDDSLTPNNNYTYQAIINNKTTNAISAKTLDTTSGNFTWQVLRFGSSSSVLNDVAIISNTSIWVVGELEIKDSVGYYNAAHWNGKAWNLKAIYYYDSYGQQYWNPINALIAFSNDDIWFSNFTHWDGKKFNSVKFNISFHNSIDAIWGTSSKDFYIVGENGAIAYYNGNWQKIESGTTLDIYDIWGIVNPVTNQEEVYCVASNREGIVTKEFGKKVLKISGGNVTEISNTGLPLSLSSIWFPPNSNRMYIVGDGIYRNYPVPKDSTWENISDNITHYYSYKIRGNGLNDIFICGGYGDFAHFNGVRWTDYIGNGLQTINGNLYGLAVRGNTVCAVGGDGDKAIIIIGRR